MHREPSVTLRGLLTIVCLVLLMVSSAGCYHHHAVALKSNSTDMLSTATDPESKVVVQWAWNLSKTTFRITNCNGQGLAKVWVESNLVFDILKVTTLGFIAPATIKWQCAVPNIN